MWYFNNKMNYTGTHLPAFEITKVAWDFKKVALVSKMTTNLGQFFG